MHQIVFDLKRGHLKTVAYGEKLLKGVPDMTAARFDLLCLVRQQQILEGGEFLTTGMTQWELWKRLDLDKSTVSKMLRRLEEMGWIRRERIANPRLRKTRKVFLTALGLQRIAKAMRIMFRQRPLLAYFERIYKDRAYPRWHRHVVASLLEESERIQYIADCFGDRSLICYDYGPALAEGPWVWIGPHRREPHHWLYRPPPTPRLPPKRKGPRLPCRPFEFTDYEKNLRDYIWGDDKRRRKKKRPALAYEDA